MLSLLVFEVSAALLSSVAHFVHVSSELRSMANESVPQTNYSPKLLFTNLRGVVYAYKFIFELTIFLLSGENVMCTCGFVLQSDW